MVNRNDNLDMPSRDDDGNESAPPEAPYGRPRGAPQSHPQKTVIGRWQDLPPASPSPPPHSQHMPPEPPRGTVSGAPQFHPPRTPTPAPPPPHEEIPAWAHPAPPPPLGTFPAGPAAPYPAYAPDPRGYDGSHHQPPPPPMPVPDPRSGPPPEEFVSAATCAERAKQVQVERPRAPRRSESPERRRVRDLKAIRLMQFAMSALFFVALVAIMFFVYSRYQLDRPGPLQQPVAFEVGRGQHLNQIAEGLEKNGIIYDRKLFVVNVLARKMARRLKAGRYSIPERASMQKVLDILVSGKAIYNQITVVEGTTSEQTVELLRAHPLLVGEIAGIPPEGSLMPETYQFNDAMDRNELLTRMRKAQSEFLAEKWAARQPDLPLKTPEEALVLASIVEKETGVPEERRKVAGVFVNRLRKRMRLQSDPTIIYGLVGGKGRLGHPLLRSEMAIKTAYNTYQIDGLPPTPIANPGRQAIEAVLDPEKTDHLYFVADGSGGHAFAADLKAHRENVLKWRQVEAERRREEAIQAETEPLPGAAPPAGEVAKASSDAQPAQAVAVPATAAAGVAPGEKLAEPRISGVTVAPAVPGAKNEAKLEVAPSEPVPSGRGGWDDTIPPPSRKPPRKK